jgi:hypothetical protein
MKILSFLNADVCPPEKELYFGLSDSQGNTQWVFDIKEASYIISYNKILCPSNRPRTSQEEKTGIYTSSQQEKERNT